MKALFAALLIIVLGFTAHLFLPWWIIALICFLIGLSFIDSAWQAFFIGFSMVFLLWFITAAVKSYQNDFILINRMAELLPIHNTWVIMIITGLIGGLVGGLSTLTGYFLQSINEKKKRRFS